MVFGWPQPALQPPGNAGAGAASGVGAAAGVGASIARASGIASGNGAATGAGAFSDPGGGDTLITRVTVTNTSASSKTNDLLVFGFPMSDTALGLADNLSVNDDNGAGGIGARLANFQINNQASDLNGKRRFASVAGTLPIIGAGSTRVLSIFRSGSSPPSGTGITTSQILALGCMANGGVVVNATVAGITYSRTLASAMAGGSSFSKTAACDRGDYRTGVAMYERIFQAPLQNGGVAHAGGDGLAVEFHVKAWKASTGPVSLSNPILGLVVDVLPINGWRAVAVQYTVSSASIQRATSLTNATLITTNDTDPDGNTQFYNFTTSVTFWGNAEAPRRRVYIGQKPTCIVMLGDATLTGGTAATPTDSQLADYLASTKLWPKYGKRLANINHSSRISRLNSTNRSLLLHTSGGFIGNLNIDLNDGGEWPDRGIVAGFTVEGVLKPDAQGRRIIFENADYLLTARTHGIGLNYNSTTEKFFKPGDSYPSEAGESAGDPWTYGQDGGTHHEPEQAYTAYLLTGDYCYYTALNSRAASYPGYANTSSGTGANMTFLGDWSKGGQWGDHYAGTNSRRWIKSNIEVRAAAWSLRTIWQQALVCPDRFTSANLLSWSKATSRQFWQRHLERAKNVITESTGPSSTYNRFGITGPRYYTDFGHPWEFAPWFQGYMGMSCFRAQAAGMMDANGIVFTEWQADWYRDAFNSSAVWIDGYLHGYWDPFGNVALNAPLLSTEAFYERIAGINPTIVLSDSSNAQSHRWNVPGTATLSAASGSSITVTLPASMLSTSRESWYVGKWFCQHSGGTAFGPGVGQITAVNSPTSITISTTVAGGAAFSSTSLGTNNWSMCLPACPEDHPGNGTMILSESLAVGAEDHYVDISRSTNAEAASAGISGMLPIYNALNTWKPNVGTGNDGLSSNQFDMRPA